MEHNYALFARVIQEECANQPSTTPCACLIEFYNEAYIPKVEMLVKPLLATLTPQPEPFKQYGDRLVAFCAGVEQAETLANALEHALRSFDQKLLMQPFESLWLDDFLQAKHLGVSYVYADVHVLPDDIEDGLRTRDTYRRDPDSLNSRLLYKAITNVLDYDNITFTERLSEFMIANFTHAGAPKDLRWFASELMLAMKELTEDQDFLHVFTCRTVLDAVTRKAAVMEAKKAMHVEGVLDSSAEVEQRALVIRETICKPFLACISKINHARDCDRVAKVLIGIMHEKHPEISIRGLGELVAGDDSDRFLTVPFYGLDLSYDGDLNITKRLAPQTVKREVQINQSSVIREIAYALANYYVGVLELKHEQRLKVRIIEAAKYMDIAPLLPQLMTLIEATRPNQKDS
jgi:hypothetical protein